jgi:hypothetical protein
VEGLGYVPRKDIPINLFDVDVIYVYATKDVLCMQDAFVGRMK